MCACVGVVCACGVWCGCVVWGDGVVVCTYARAQRTYVRNYTRTYTVQSQTFRSHVNLKPHPRSGTSLRRSRWKARLAPGKLGPGAGWWPWWARPHAMTKPRGRAETAVARSYGAKEKGEAELTVYCKALKESRSSGLESKVCGTYVRKFHLQLNIGARP